MAAVAAGEVERGDETLPGGASRQQMEGQPDRQRHDDGDEDTDAPIGGLLNLLSQLYGARIEAAGRTLPQHERAAAVRALRRELQAARRAITEPRQATRAARRRRMRKRRGAHQPRPS